MNYKDLIIWQLSRKLVVEMHEMALKKLPRFEMYKEGGQIRRSSKTVKSTIVEGCGRRSYKRDFIKLLNYALSSNDETIDHLEALFEIKSLNDEQLYSKLKVKLNELGRRLNNFIPSVEKQHLSKK